MIRNAIIFISGMVKKLQKISVLVVLMLFVIPPTECLAGCIPPGVYSSCSESEWERYICSFVGINVLLVIDTAWAPGNYKDMSVSIHIAKYACSDGVATIACGDQRASYQINVAPLEIIGGHGESIALVNVEGYQQKTCLGQGYYFLLSALPDGK